MDSDQSNFPDPVLDPTIKTHKTSVVDPNLFFPDPDPALNFPSSGSRLKFRIHADPDPTHVI